MTTVSAVEVDLHEPGPREPCSWCGPGMVKNRVQHCPQCSGSGTVPKQQMAVRKDRKGNDETYTETVQVDCPTCDGSGSVVDFS